jgi:hypothetical protein
LPSHTSLVAFRGMQATECDLRLVLTGTDFPSIQPVTPSGTIRVDFAEAIQAEHICLETEETVVDGRLGGKQIGPSLRIADRFRGCETELAVLEGHRLAVRSRRPRQIERRYVVDLRFVDSTPVIGRRIASRCWQACVALATVAVLSGWLSTLDGAPAWLHLRPSVWLASIVVAIGTGVLALYRTYERIEFLSLHGRARLAEITGGLGSSRAAASFTTGLARRIEDARTHRQQSAQQFLRDELREHRRLLGESVLSEKAYQASKQRILQSHGRQAVGPIEHTT